MALKLSKKNNKVKKIIKKANRSQQQAKVAAQDPLAHLTVPSGKYTEAVGRRKVASARVRIYESEGDFIVNNQHVSDYFANVPNAAVRYMLPFEVTETKGTFSVRAIVSGSGMAAQIDAIVHGISRALVAHDPELRPALKAKGLLTRDDRMKETRKIGTGGKARRKRQSPKR